MIKFSDAALKLAPWSLTKIETAINCGLKFNLQYVKKVKQGKPPKPEGAIGKAVHRAQELILKGEPPERAYRVAAVDNKLTTNERDTLDTFYDATVNFLERIKKFEAEKPVEKKLIEYQFGLTADLKPTGFFSSNVFFRGVYDFSMKLESEDLIIIDHKSGEPSTEINKYSSQLKLYAVAGKILYPSIKGAQSAIHWLRNGQIVWGDYTKAEEIVDAHIKWFEAFINESVANLTDTPRTGWYCDYCGYTARCPLYGGKG